LLGAVGARIIAHAAACTRLALFRARPADRCRGLESAR
jgi:hypothetical protein